MTEQARQAAERVSAAAAAIQCRDDVCSRSTLAGLAQEFDFIPEQLVTASASLCGGTGSASGSCGAYCAGLLAVGLYFNSSIAQELAHRDEDVFGRTTAAKFTEYRDRFLARYGTILCPKIQEQLFGRGYILSDPRDQQAFFELPGHAEVCAQVVAFAAGLAAEMIAEKENEK